LVDNQLPPALAEWLTTKGCTATHVLDLNLARATDDAIWAAAVRDRLIIVTKDEDFSRLVVLRPEPVQVVWLRIGNCRTVALLEAMERTWNSIVAELESGSRLIEVV
jgi:predicted nuclease of predicted toxin-antitoxin system